MRVLKFTETDEAKSADLRFQMIDQINTWSRLQHLCDDPDYVTQPFQVSIWQPHTTLPGVWWLDFDMLYANLGDDGRKVADWAVGGVGELGVVPRLPDCNLTLIEVTDLVWEGYLPTPVDNIMP